MILKPEKQDSSSSSSSEEGEEEIKNPMQYDHRSERAPSAEVSDKIIIINGQAHYIRPMSPRSFRKWSRNLNYSLNMHRLSEKDLSLDDQDSWVEISQKV